MKPEQVCLLMTFFAWLHLSSFIMQLRNLRWNLTFQLQTTWPLVPHVYSLLWRVIQKFSSHSFCNHTSTNLHFILRSKPSYWTLICKITDKFINNIWDFLVTIFKHWGNTSYPKLLLMNIAHNRYILMVFTHIKWLNGCNFSLCIFAAY